MDKTRAALVLAVCSLAIGLVAAQKEGPVTPAARIRSMASYAPPSDWIADEGALGEDPFVTFTRAPHVLRIQMLGGPASRHLSQKAFLSSFEAKDRGGKPARSSAIVKVAGVSLPLYERSFSRTLGAPKEGGGMREEVREEFVVVPGGKRFFVLSWQVRSPDGDAVTEGRPAWEALRASFSPRGARPARENPPPPSAPKKKGR